MKMTLYQCQTLAREVGYNSMEFLVVMKSGITHRAKWLDAYYGIMEFPEIEELKGKFVTFNQIDDDVSHCLKIDQQGE